MKYKYILFDLDGTLTDPKIGITKSVQYALEKFNIEVENLDELIKFIGPPLKNSFEEFFNFDDGQSIKAVKYYREYFKEQGMFENQIYGGILSLLEKLKKLNYVLIVATSKPTVFSEQILKHFSLDKYFIEIVGSNLDNTRSNKGELIKYIVDKYKITDLQEVVMVGDRKYDIIGAKDNNVASIGVTYGYGSKEELEISGATYIVESVQALEDLIIGIEN